MACGTLNLEVTKRNCILNSELLSEPAGELEITALSDVPRGSAPGQGRGQTVTRKHKVLKHTLFDLVGSELHQE